MSLQGEDVAWTHTLVIIDFFYRDLPGGVGTCLCHWYLRGGAYWKFRLDIQRRNRLREESLESFGIYTIIIYGVVLFRMNNICRCEFDLLL